MPPPAVGSNGETNSQQTLEALLRIEARLRSNELAIASNGAEAQLAAARNAEAVGKALQTLGGAIAVQQEALSTTSTRELEAIHGSNRFMLIVAGSFAALTCLAMLVMAYFQWRSSRIWSDISSGLKNGNGAGGMGGALASLPAAGLSPASVSAGDASSRLLGAMEQLERRLQLLEGVTRPALHAPLPEFIPGENGDELENYDGTDQTNGEESVSGREHRRIATLLKEGQARLKDNDLQAALHCYDEVLAIEPDQPEALVKKGVALERLHKLNEAFECYDRAITVDGSSTIAYLHKGGLCNRLERFKEALECYEKALQIHNEARD